MPVDQQSSARLAAIICGVENHVSLMRFNGEHAYRIAKNVKLRLEYQAILTVARRLELLVTDCAPPATFDLLDIADGALRVPFPMDRKSEFALLRFVRACLGSSPIAKIKISEDREVAVLAWAYNEDLHTSELKIMESSRWRSFPEAA